MAPGRWPLRYSSSGRISSSTNGSARSSFHFSSLRLSSAVAELLDLLRTCSVCNAVTDREVCATCSDPQRSDRVICVVEEPPNLLAAERTHDFKGRYHVLHGALSPLQGVGPDEL